jgi:hypothetical protein
VFLYRRARRGWTCKLRRGRGDCQIVCMKDVSPNVREVETVHIRMGSPKDISDNGPFLDTIKCGSTSYRGVNAYSASLLKLWIQLLERNRLLVRRVPRWAHLASSPNHARLPVAMSKRRGDLLGFRSSRCWRFCGT